MIRPSTAGADPSVGGLRQVTLMREVEAEIARPAPWWVRAWRWTRSVLRWIGGGDYDPADEAQ